MEMCLCFSTAIGSLSNANLSKDGGIEAAGIPVEVTPPLRATPFVLPTKSNKLRLWRRRE